MRRILVPLVGLVVVITTVVNIGRGQQPMLPQPPALLPPSITGQPTPVPSPVVPVVAQKPGVPADRFLLQPLKQPPEAMQAVYSSRSAAEWLARLNQANGRFLAGVNPSLARPLPDDNDLRQAQAAVAIARAATFTADEKLTACAGQSILALLTLAPEDPADRTCRVPKMAADRGDRIGFAAALALAIYDMPKPDPKLLAEADRLCAYLRKQCQEDGMVKAIDASTSSNYAGLCFEALMASDRHTPTAWKRDTVSRGCVYYREALKTTPSAAISAQMLPAVCELYLRTKTEAVAAFGYELADRLCDLQYSLDDSREVRWVGGFKANSTDTAEPTAMSIACADALASATRLAANVPDVTRFTKYRKAAIQALAFSRSLQFTDETTTHFEKKFRGTFLLGGVFGSLSDGNPRLDHTAQIVIAQLRFLESGGERGE